MSPQYRRIVAAAAATVLILLPGLAFAVEARFDLSSPASSPFPSDRFTVDDHDQKTGLRVSLPKPDCAVRVSDCADIDVINTLDGFNLQPRLSIPFSGPIDVSTVKELCRRWYPKALVGAPTKAGGHRALDDVRESLAELRYYRATIFREAESRQPDTTA